ncbi:MAG: sigma 54-interacting transcriptional regulator [Syntrophomonas sp.]|nr:sigma 54-interacting transcriptional regulator [Syntrophomonas sp.]
MSNTSPPFIESGFTIIEASRFILKHNLEGAQVIDTGGNVIGLLTRVHLLEAIAEGHPPETNVMEIMSYEPEMINFVNDLQLELAEYERSLSIIGEQKSINYDANSLICRFAQIFRSSRKQWNACLNSIYNPVITVDDKGNLQFVNKAAERIFGISFQEVYGLNINEVFDNSKLADIVKSGQTEATQTIEAVGKTFLSNRSPIYVDGKIVGAVSVLQDTSELESVLQELANTKKLNQQLDAIIESSFDGLYITDGEGNTLRLNQGFERIMGVVYDECIGRNMRDLVDESVFPRSCTLLALEQGSSVTISLQAKTGKNALVTSTPIYDDGIPILVVTNVRDISELNELERKLEHVEGLRRKELDAIFESSYDGLYITDGEANTLMLNQGFERIMGVNSAECIGRNMKDLVKEGIYSASGTLLALEQGKSVTISLQAKTGKNALVTSTPIYDDDGHIILVVTNVRDITELNELQGKLEQLEGLSRLYQEELQNLKLLNSKKCVIHSPKMQELMKMVVHIASVDSTVLIQGESGVGKELIANILYSNSNRKNGPFIKINCGAIPHNLIESELFGYEPGAFTGASKKGKAGMFELAIGGMIFLDEIGDLPLDLQVKLLRVIQEMEITRIGATEPTKIDVRIVTGTNRNLYEMMGKHLFRKDLYYRLNVVPIFIPPLRERRDDIPVFSKYFLEYFNLKYNMKKELSSYVLQRFMSYDWPGNVRELENLIERLVVTTMHDTISLYDLAAWSNVFKTPADMELEIIPLQSALENTERQLLQNAFSIHNSTYAVARALGISQPTVVRKAAKYGIKRS